MGTDIPPRHEDWRRQPSRREVDLHEDGPRRYHPAMAAACIVLAIAVIGLAWYAYPRFRQQNVSLNQLRDELHGRVQHDRVRSDADKLRADLRERIDSAGKKASQAVEDAYGRMKTKLNAESGARSRDVSALKERVSNLETSRAADQRQLAELKQEVNDVRSQADRSSQLAGQQTAPTDQNGEDRAGTNQLAVEKVPFEVSKDRQSTLADGVSLYLSGIDVTRRSVTGRVWLPVERRTIWLREQSVLDPVIFSSQDGHKRELVITDVSSNSVDGYLLLQKQNDQAPAGLAGAGGE